MFFRRIRRIRRRRRRRLKPLILISGIGGTNSLGQGPKKISDIKALKRNTLNLVCMSLFVFVVKGQFFLTYVLMGEHWVSLEYCLKQMETDVFWGRYHSVGDRVTEDVI